MSITEQRFRLKNGSNHYDKQGYFMEVMPRFFAEGVVLELTLDDYSSRPEFTCVGGGGSFWIRWESLKEVVSNKHPLHSGTTFYDKSSNFVIKKYHNVTGFGLGGIVKLFKDDHSHLPKFICEATGAKSFYFWSSLEEFTGEETLNQEFPLSDGSYNYDKGGIFSYKDDASQLFKLYRDDETSNPLFATVEDPHSFEKCISWCKLVVHTEEVENEYPLQDGSKVYDKDGLFVIAGGNMHDQATGNVFKLDTDDETRWPYFLRQSDGERLPIEWKALLPYTAVPEVKQEYALGDGSTNYNKESLFTCEVPDGSSYSVGDVLKLRRDDGTRFPFFSNLTKGTQVVAYWSELLEGGVDPSEVVEEVPVEEVIGYTLANGDKVDTSHKLYVVTGEGNPENYNTGDLLTLDRDDGSTCPYFINLRKDETSCVFWSKLMEVSGSLATKLPLPAGVTRSTATEVGTRLTLTNQHGEVSIKVDHNVDNIYRLKEDVIVPLLLGATFDRRLIDEAFGSE